jgi:Zn-dependent peptidase ImmA (M78 family)
MMEKPRYGYARQMARKVLKDCGITEPPVDLEYLLEKQGYEYLEVDTFPKKVDALFVETAGSCYFAVNGCHHLHRKRFSVAHEFGHILLKHNVGYYDTEISIDTPPEAQYHTNAEDAFEKEANAFAGELLIPLDMLKKEFGRSPEIPVLAKLFLVSQDAMAVAISNNMRSLYK